MKKTALVITMVLLAVFIGAMLVACTPAKPEDIYGTYKLMSYYDKTDGEPDVNKMEVNECDAYIVVSSDTKGYYFKKDKDSGWRGFPVKITFNKSSDDESKVASVDFEAPADESVYETKNLMVDKSNRDMYLKRVQNTISGSFLFKDGYDICYKKVSKATDTSYVTKKIGNVAMCKFEEYKFHGLFSLELANQGTPDEYICYFTEFDMSAKKAKVAKVMKKNKESSITEYNLTVNFNEDGSGTLSYADQTFEFDTIGNLSKKVTTEYGEETYYLYKIRAFGYDTLENLVREALESYEGCETEAE